MLVRRKRYYNHFNYNHRRRLEELLRKKVSIAKIADILGFSRQSIYNEIKRGIYMHRNTDYTEEERYCADIAHEKAIYNSTAKGGKLKIDCDLNLARKIEELIIDFGYSPAAALRYIQNDESTLYEVKILSVNTIYAYIDKGVFERLERKHLPRRKKYKATKRIVVKKENKECMRHKNRPTELSIESRALDVLLRRDFGHWEMDCVVGKRGNKKTLLVLTERFSRYEIIEVLKSKTVEEVTKALNRLEKRMGAMFYKVFKSVTVDNGSEFLNFNKLKKSLRRKGDRFKLFYCHPYSSWERGSNENNNILIRRFLPKSTNFDKHLTFKKAKKIEKWMNDYPREILGGLTAKHIFEIEVRKLRC